MPPTEVNQFELKMPINNKWIVERSTVDHISDEHIQMNEPEYVIDFTVSYHMRYSRATIDAYNLFARSMEKGARSMSASPPDVVTDSGFQIFPGVLDLVGRSSSDDIDQLTKAGLPAFSPTITPKLTLALADSAVQEILALQKLGGANEWPRECVECLGMKQLVIYGHGNTYGIVIVYSGTKRELFAVLEGFRSLTIEWPVSGADPAQQVQVISVFTHLDVAPWL